MGAIDELRPSKKIAFSPDTMLIGGFMIHRVRAHHGRRIENSERVIATTRAIGNFSEYWLTEMPELCTSMAITTNNTGRTIPKSNNHNELGRANRKFSLESEFREEENCLSDWFPMARLIFDPIRPTIR